MFLAFAPRYTRFKEMLNFDQSGTRPGSFPFKPWKKTAPEFCDTKSFIYRNRAVKGTFASFPGSASTFRTKTFSAFPADVS